MKVKSESEVAQSCLTLSNPMDSSFPSSSIHGIFQARVLEWGANAFSIVYLKCAKRVLSFLITQKRKKLITVIQICLLAIWWWWFHIEELACQCRRHSVQFNSVQSLSRVWLFATLWTTACQASLSITNSRVHPNPCPLSWWCHPTIPSSVVSFSSCPQSFLASGSFQMSQLFTSGGQSSRVSASKSVLPMNTQDWTPLGIPTMT